MIENSPQLIKRYISRVTGVTGVTLLKTKDLRGYTKVTPSIKGVTSQSKVTPVTPSKISV